MKLTIPVIVALLIIISTSVRAEDLSTTQMKSETTAWILGLDPIPGDALFYSGHWVQGTINTALGLFTGAGLGVAIGMALDDGNCTPEEAGTFGCAVGQAFDDSIDSNDALFLTTTSVSFLAVLLWDGIAGIRYVKRHNRALQATELSWWQKIEPSISPFEGTYGIAATFRF